MGTRDEQGDQPGSPQEQPASLWGGLGGGGGQDQRMRKLNLEKLRREAAGESVQSSFEEHVLVKGDHQQG